ncbi:MAG TPA: Na+/H+ antiporter subunit E [Steroidobacteraceae bacterium]|jgi:multicomponent K+:H+ antiporter subunit E
MSQVPTLLTLALIAIWVILNDELSIAQLGFGTLLAVLLTLAIAQLRPVRPRVRQLRLALPLAATVLVDILHSNLGVARIVLGLVRDREVHSGFLDIPLELRDPHGLAILAVIVTSTPGTSWAGVSPDGRMLKLHILDLRDEAGWIHLIKERYERPLMRIFE